MSTRRRGRKKKRGGAGGGGGGGGLSVDLPIQQRSLQMFSIVHCLQDRHIVSVEPHEVVTSVIIVVKN